MLLGRYCNFCLLVLTGRRLVKCTYIQQNHSPTVVQSLATERSSTFAHLIYDTAPARLTTLLLCIYQLLIHQKKTPIMDVEMRRSFLIMTSTKPLRHIMLCHVVGRYCGRCTQHVAIPSCSNQTLRFCLKIYYSILAALMCDMANIRHALCSV